MDTFQLLLRSITLVLLLAARSAPAQPPAAEARLPALVGSTALGERVDLQGLRGKVVLLFFWSTDCQVCLDKMPEFRRNLQGWRGKDFVIVAVNQDRRLDELRRYEQALDTLMPRDPQMKILWRRDGAFRDNLGEMPTRMPTSLLIDRSGRIVRHWRGGMAPALWDDIAELVLN